MEPLDGNAIAGALYDVYGEDMTMATGRCTVCGATGPLAELRVYVRAPGMVARCRVCDNVEFVLVEIREETRMFMTCLEMVD
jgi:Family of unknown function (DUF6510)